MRKRGLCSGRSIISFTVDADALLAYVEEQAMVSKHRMVRMVIITPAGESGSMTIEPADDDRPWDEGADDARRRELAALIAALVRRARR